MDITLLQDILRRPEDFRTFKAGQAIFKEGEMGYVMYVLLEGVVEVQVGHKVIGAFEPIEMFGEMAVIDAGPRSATVTAKTDSKLAAINQNRFLFMIRQKPELAIHIMRMLVERIRWMNTEALNHAAKAALVEPAPESAPAEEEVGATAAVAAAP